MFSLTTSHTACCVPNTNTKLLTWCVHTNLHVHVHALPNNCPTHTRTRTHAHALSYTVLYSFLHCCLTYTNTYSLLHLECTHIHTHTLTAPPQPSTPTPTTPSTAVSPAKPPNMAKLNTLQRKKLDFSTKLQNFKIMMTRLGFSQGSRLKFNIRRDHLLEDAYEHVMKSNLKHLQMKRLNISFKGEEGWVFWCMH